MFAQRFGMSTVILGYVPKADGRNEPRSNVKMNLEMAKSLFSRRARVGGLDVYTSVTLSLTKLAFTYASNIVRWVWKCPGHSPERCCRPWPF